MQYGNGNNAVGGGGYTYAPAVPTTAGTAVNVLGLPVASRYDIILNDVSVNANANLFLQLRTGAGIPASTYKGSYTSLEGAALTSGNNAASAGIVLGQDQVANGDFINGIITVMALDKAAFAWMITFMVGTYAGVSASRVMVGTLVMTNLTAALTGFTLTTSAGTAVFDNGQIVVASLP